MPHPRTPGARPLAHLLLALLLLALVAVPAGRAVAEEPAAASDEDRAALKAMVEPLRADVERLRGLSWSESVPADLLTRARARANLERELEEEYLPHEMERDTRILRRLGLLAPKDDIRSLLSSLYGGMIAGYYDPREKAFYCVEGLPLPAQKPTIVHELVHALEDQHVGLEPRARPLADDTDRLFAEKAIQEGAAEWVRLAWEKENPGIAALAQAQMNPQMLREQMEVLRTVPAFLLMPVFLQYEQGKEFVAALVARHGSLPAAMAALYADPPVSQAQILRPEKYLDEPRDLPQAIVFAGDPGRAGGRDWRLLHQYAVGELDLMLYLDHFLGGRNGRLLPGRIAHPRAREAVDGWDGGWLRVYEDIKTPEAPLGIVDVYVFVSVEAATRAADALLEATRRASGSTWTALTPEDGGDARAVSWIGAFGPGRLAQRGTAVLRAEGFPMDTFRAVWESLLRTTFARDPRDR